MRNDPSRGTIGVAAIVQQGSPQKSDGKYPNQRETPSPGSAGMKARLWDRNHRGPECSTASDNGYQATEAATTPIIAKTIRKVVMSAPTRRPGATGKKPFPSNISAGE